MSFRNISRSTERSIRVSRNRDRGRLRSAVQSPNDNFKSFSQQIYDFAVANWVAVILSAIAGIGAGVLGFYIGKYYSGAEVGKDIAKKFGLFDLFK